MDVPVTCFMPGSGSPFLGMYVFPASNTIGPIGPIRQHFEFSASVRQVHPGAVAESDIDIHAMQGGVRHRASQATFTYPQDRVATGRALRDALP
jgi:hypothetical protein